MGKYSADHYLYFWLDQKYHKGKAGSIPGGKFIALRGKRNELALYQLLLVLEMLKQRFFSSQPTAEVCSVDEFTVGYSKAVEEGLTPRRSILDITCSV